MIKYVLFDFDGTLVDSKEVLISTINQLAGKYQFKSIGQQDIEILKSLSVRERCRYLRLPLYKIPFLALDVYKLYYKSLNQLSLFRGIKELLSDLKKNGYEVAIISSNSEKNIREFLQQNQISGIREVICSNNILGKEKLIRKFLKAGRLKNSEVIYIGDELRDITACKKSNIKIVWVSWGYDELESIQQEEPDYIVYKPAEILALV